MHVAGLHLCEELYELSGWDVQAPGAAWWYTYPDDSAAAYFSERPEHWDEAIKKIPAYDLGYLLRKLPPATIIRRNKKRGKDWSAGFYDTGAGYRNTSIAKTTADTPEDAACKLAIELFKNGVLTK